MALRNILINNDKILHNVCKPVNKFDKKLSVILDDMHQTLDKAKGLGLAAPQIGICRRIFIMHLENCNVVEAINPQIILKTGKQRVLEGCLSYPNIWGYVTRPKRVIFKAQDRNGDWYKFAFTNLGAQCSIHEIDHLDGHVFTEIIEEFLISEEK